MIWKKIPGFSDVYEASDTGLIRRLPYFYTAVRDGGEVTWDLGEKLLGGSKLSKKGYRRVNLEGKVYFVHRLVASAFIPNPKNLPQINHIDGDKLNNRVDNLGWVSNQENRNHAVTNGLHPCRENGNCKLSVKDVVEIKRLHKIGVLQKDIASRFNVVQQTISKVLNEET